MGFKAYIRVIGVNFGSFKDKDNQLYSVQMYNPVSGLKSKFFSFHFKNRNEFTIKFNLDVNDKEHQFFVLYIHKIKTFTKELIGQVNIPFSAFPLNAVCHETVELQMNRKQEIPMSISFDIHLNENNSPAWSAPPGVSQLECFDPQKYANEHMLFEDSYSLKKTSYEERLNPSLY